MTTLKNKNGMGMITMLGIVIFLLASVGTALTFVVNDAFSVNRDVVNKTDYANAVNAIDATIQLMRPTLLDGTLIDPTTTEWVIVQNELNVSITMTDFGYRIARPLGSRFVAGYITYAGGVGTTFATTRARINNPALRTAALLDTFIDYKFGIDDDFVPTFQDKVDYLKTQYHNMAPSAFPLNGAITTNTFVTGDMEIKNGGGEVSTIDVLPGRVLVIDGDLTISRNGFEIKGVVIVSGNVFFNNNATLRGTLFVGGTVDTRNNTQIGIEGDTSYLFAQGQININNVARLTGFIISDTGVSISNASNLTGGVYAHDSDPIINGSDPSPLDNASISVNETGITLIDNATQNGEPTVMTVRPQIE